VPTNQTFRIRTMKTRFRRFNDVSMSERILNTLFLLAIGAGYLFALANLYYTHQARDGEAGLSIKDIMIAYHGASSKTRLEAAVTGIMEPNLRYKSDKDVILRWLRDGATEAGYQERVSPILNRDCVVCHNPASNPTLPNLTTYEGVSEVAHAGGASLPALVRVSHIHLFGIAFILYFIGRIFLLCHMNPVLKRIIVAIPFLAMFLDIAAWFITRYFPDFAYVVVMAGGLMGLSMGGQILISLYQMWFSAPHPASQPLSRRERVAECKMALEELGHELKETAHGWIIAGLGLEPVKITNLGDLEAFTRSLQIRHHQMD